MTADKSDASLSVAKVEIAEKIGSLNKTIKQNAEQADAAVSDANQSVLFNRNTLSLIQAWANETFNKIGKV